MRWNEHISLALIGICFLAFTHVQCNKKISSNTIGNTTALEALGTQLEDRDAEQGCRDPLNYVPKDSLLIPTRYIRVNAHFMNSTGRIYNFNGEDGKKYFKHLLRNANRRLRDNKKMNLPEGNNTPAYHPRYQYVLTASEGVDSKDGIYFHYDDELAFFVNKGRNRNNYKRDMIKKYAVGEDSILNIFIVPHHPDSLKTGRYKATSTGIALGTSIKVAGLAENRKEPWAFATLLNHEVGHVFGLNHSYDRKDDRNQTYKGKSIDCDDTPRNPNCWHPDKNKSGCEGPISNNMMDYNNSQMAISPCQLGLIHRNIADKDGKVRKLMRPDWCYRDDSRTIMIDQNKSWNGSLDLSHNVVVTSGNQLNISCRVSMAPGSSIVVEPGAKLILNNCKLHNDCDKTWEGIQIQSSGSKIGAVEYIGTVEIENVKENTFSH